MPNVPICNSTWKNSTRKTSRTVNVKSGIWQAAFLFSAMLLTLTVIFPGIPYAAESSGPYLYVFSSTSETVTVIDTATLEVLGTRPTGFKVMWLADNMNSFDGRLLWTYGMRHVEVGGKKQLKIDVIAFDPRQLKVVKRIEVGNGPAHSVVLTPDRKQAIINVAGDNIIAFIDVESGNVVERLSVGKFPCDMSLSPDGRFAYFPERDQDTLAKLDLATHQVVKRISLAPGSKPHMNRVSPNGETLWAQTATTNLNQIYDAQSLELLNVQRVGNRPTTNAWTPDGKYSLVMHRMDNKVFVIGAEPPYQPVKEIEVGPWPGVAAFHPDGTFAYVSVRGLNAVAVIDLNTLEVKTMLPGGENPVGMVLLDIRPEI
ncbi:MAG: hypothetical protein IID61_13820 [SAR324 cluster bacterium]|nr:hypothetical protein [SAR324 cluster bacterium]